MTPPDASVLVVDDDASVLFLLEELLVDEGYIVHVAATISDARQAIAEHAPDVVLLDVQLPDGSGFDLCTQLRADPRTVDLPILLLSAVGRGSHFVARGLDLGAYDFLPKPFYNDELLARVRVLVRLRRLQQRLIEQERDRAMLATAGAAAHSLGQPLMAAMGAVTLLRQTPLMPEQQADIELLEAALRQMSDVVRQIQDVQHYIGQPYLDKTSDLEILNLDQAGSPRPDQS
jgi:DNA-binding response OmpR family regulator